MATSIQLTDIIQLEQLHSIVERLHVSIQLGCCIVDPQGKKLIEHGWKCLCNEHQCETEYQQLSGCISSKHLFTNLVNAVSRKSQVTTCRHGFSSVGAPIHIDGELIACIFIGLFVIEPQRTQHTHSLPADQERQTPSTPHGSGITIIPTAKVQRMATHLELLADLIGEMGRNHLLENRIHSTVKKSETHLRNLVDSLPQVVYETDRNGRITFLNQSGYKILGYTEEDLDNGLNRSSFIPDKEKSRFDDRFRRILAGDQLPSIECSILRRNGRLFDAMLSSYPLYDDGDQIIGARGLIFDISDHKQVQRDLWESEQKYRMLFDQSYDAILIIDEQTVIDFNAKALKLFEIRREELEGMDFRTLVNTIESRNQDQLISHVTSAKPYSVIEQAPFEWLFSRKDNVQVEAEVVADKIDLVDRNIIQLTIHDVTLERQNKRKLETREAAWQAMFEHAPFGIAINRLKDGQYLDVNPAMLELANRNEQQIIGKASEQFLPANQHGKSQAVVRELQERGYSGLQETEVIRRDGTPGYVIYSAATFKSGDETNVVSMVVDISERRKMEQRLQESEAILKSLFDAVPVGLAILKDRVFLAVNERLAEITGYTAESMLDQTPRFLYFNDDDYTAIGQLIYNSPSGDSRTFAETRFRHKNGSLRHISLFAAQLDPDNPAAGTAVAVQDITEERQIVRALQESESRYRSLFEAAGDAIILTRNKRFIDCNQKTLDIFLCKREEIIGRSPEDISPARQADGRKSSELIKQLITQAESGNILNFEWIHRRPDGSTFVSEVSLSRVVLSGEEVLQAIIRDISERKQSEKFLRESEFRFRSFFHTNPEGIVLIDFQGRILDANRSFLKRSGYSLDECRSAHFTTFVPEQHQEQVMQSLINLKSGLKPPEALQATYRAKNGEVIPVSLRSWVVTDEASTPLYFGVFIHDLTREMELAEEKITLEKQVIRAQKSEAIGTLANGIAHDFNNILSGIIGFTELALYRDPAALDAKLEEYLKRVLEGSNRAKGLVQQILRFSRNSDTVMEPVSLKPLMKETLLLLESTIPSTITIKHELLAQNDTILGDSTQLHQIIMNLATNGHHAMRETGGTLLLKVENLMLKEARHFLSMTIPPGEYARISVADTGCGMTPAVLERIFEPYFTTKKINEGTGLGMAVVLGIVKSHRGLISVESTPGKGTVFSVYFPTCLGEESRAEHTRSTLPLGHGQRILIVDDEAYFLEVVDENLRILGYQVTSCSRSAEALEKLRESPAEFDLLVTDQTMPGMTGVQLIHEVRKIRESLPVILCTGFSEVVTEQSAEYYGINHFLMKPVSVNDLAVAVADVLAKR